MTGPVACTIVANNYLAYARSFARSFLERHPEGRVCVLIVDRPLSGHDYGSEPFDVTFADRLDIPRFSHFAFGYSILELSTAVKPYYLRHLHRALHIDRVCYFDPDILVFGDLGELYERLGRVDAVLTPHLTAPLDDAYAPSERDILKSGTYNLGFLGLSYNERTLPFLDWWSRRLYRECLHDVANGLFVDQRWMDLAPAFLPRVEILRDPGYNAAYWNLAHRQVTRRDDGWWIEGVPLRFFHFSGYDVGRPEQISRFQNRMSFVDRPDVRPLFDVYRERLDRHGHDAARRTPYAYGFFDNGVAVPDAARRGLLLVDPEATRWPDPFSTAGPDAFFDWLRQPALDDPPISRIAFMLWERRPDLQRAFPRPWQEDRINFANWVAVSAEAAAATDLELPDDHSLASSPADEETAETAPGISWREAVRVVGSEPLAPEEIRWLTADAGDEPWRRPLVPWLALEMHRQRPDLQRSFADPLGADREALAFWYATWGRQEYKLPDALVLPVVRTLPWHRRVRVRSWWRRAHRERETAARSGSNGVQARRSLERNGLASARSAPEGVNVIGMTAAATGVGEACRGTMTALASARVAAAMWSLDEGGGDGLTAVEGRTLGLPFDITMFHINADSMESVQPRLPTSMLLGRYRIGRWFWELAHFPLSFAGAFRHVDEVWAPSRFCLDAYRQISPVDVHWVPPCVLPTEAAPSNRATLGIDPDTFLFFFNFDALSIPARKNPFGLLTAFSHVAREGRVPVHLLLKINHADADPAYVDNLRSRCVGLPVTLLTGTLPRADVNGLMAACDAYVSLHRSEGLGLTLIEAMYLGKPVIATAYGGVTDFFDETTGYPVRYRLTALREPFGPYPAGAVWAEPDVEQAANLMQELARNPQGAAPRIQAAREKVQAIYAPEVAGERFRRELARIRGR